MTQIDTMLDGEGGRVNQRLEALRRSFDDDIRYAPYEESAAAEEYLLLTLSGEAYALPVAHALEVLQVPSIVPVPGVSASVLGVINFHGQILSVMSIHGVLGLTVGDPGPGSRIIVTRGLGRTTGVMADGVEGITEIKTEEIQPVPVTVGPDRACLLAGQIYMEKKLVTLLDMEQVCGSESLRMAGADPVN